MRLFTSQRSSAVMERAEEHDETLTRLGVGVGPLPVEGDVPYPWTGQMTDRLTRIKDRLFEESSGFSLSPDNFRYVPGTLYWFTSLEREPLWILFCFIQYFGRLCVWTLFSIIHSGLGSVCCFNASPSLCVDPVK